MFTGKMNFFLKFEFPWKPYCWIDSFVLVHVGKISNWSQAHMVLGWTTEGLGTWGILTNGIMISIDHRERGRSEGRRLTRKRKWWWQWWEEVVAVIEGGWGGGKQQLPDFLNVIFYHLHACCWKPIVVQVKKIKIIKKHWSPTRTSIFTQSTFWNQVRPTGLFNHAGNLVIIHYKSYYGCPVYVLDSS